MLLFSLVFKMIETKVPVGKEEHEELITLCIVSLKENLMTQTPQISALLLGQEARLKLY